MLENLTVPITRRAYQETRFPLVLPGGGSYHEGGGGHLGNREVRVRVESAWRANLCPSGPVVGVCEFDPRVMETIGLFNVTISGP